LPYDQIIIDLGAGSSLNVLDFFNLSNIGIVVTLPEPSSVENLYRFVKASFMRFVRSYIVGTELKSLYQLLHCYYADTKDTDFLRNSKEVLEIIKRYDKDIYFKIKEGLENFQLKLIINQVREREDIELGDSIEKMVIKHLGIGMSFVGYIPYDDRVYKSAKRFRPFLSEHPECSTASCMDGIACRLLNGYRLDDNEGHLWATS
jgi:flagellar biosynthesis protein FlhG